MIHSFAADREAERFWATGRSRRIPPDVQPRTLLRLNALNRARSLADLAAVPGHRFKTLDNDRAGQCGIRVNDQWPICLRWENGTVDIEFVDYH